MASENEPAKLLLPYLQRADELQKHDPLVAYYCRLYAMEKGLKIPNSERTKTTSALLVSLMNQLEKDKKTVKLGPEDNLHLEGFALNVFSKADKQDRAGRSDLNTAKTFYAASIFFEIINQFGPLQPDLEQKQKYAVWKAADIRKALKEGRSPIPGPPNGDDDLSVPSSTPHDAYDLGPHEPAVTRPQQSSDPSPQFREANNQHYTNIPPSSQFHDKIDDQHSSNISPSTPHSFPSSGYPSHDQSYPQEPQRDFHPSFPGNRSENTTYPQSYYSQPYQQDQQPHLPVNYPSSHEAPSYSYPNVQSYPNFSESGLPSSPSHYPSFHQGSETPYSTHSAPPTTNYPSTAQYSSSGRNGKIPEPSPTTPQKYQYDSNYQPPPEKIVDAHKAARFAVGALAFDDVPTAVEHLKKSLELLTNPSAGQ
ncbi:extensin-like, homolog of mammalian LYST-INTERACTING PROTEIN5 [Hibiscus trionum]|uniref:Extensin-like, homolog of mammalian LYST-INTERACTING PROTEIN5 n=1 Tax=Hibiscus trionum TaxID=183268 RepID=A0A9W7JIC9_HIBTR|nr:extensin-like, homolog of mammalian LYST-INTERACTING PROTEIN5 [Hibiscus trionum]